MRLLYPRFNHKDPLESNKLLNKPPNKPLNKSLARTPEIHINNVTRYTHLFEKMSLV